MADSKPSHTRVRSSRFSLFTSLKSLSVTTEVKPVEVLPSKFSPPLNNTISSEDAKSPLPQETGQNVTNGLYTMPSGLPNNQIAILTPVMGPEINLHKTTIGITPPSAGEVVVRIAWTGLCGSDTMFCIGPKPGFPTHNHVAGHEGIGHIVQSRDPGDLGQPVALRYLAYSCQTCKYCLRGIYTSCPKRINFPQHFNGTYQQFVTAPRHSVVPLPTYVFDSSGGVNPAAYTAALCSGSAALKAVRAVNPKPGDVVAVFGIGGAVGNLTGLIAKHVYAAKVIGVDVKSKAGDTVFETKSGNAVCDIFLCAPDAKTEKSFAAELMQACRKLRGPSEVFDHAADALICCSNRIVGFKDLVDYVCDGGSIVLNGGPSDGDKVEFPIFEILERQINIHGQLMGGASEMYQCLEYIRAGIIKPHIQEIKMEDIPQYLKNFKSLKNSGKVVARINGPMLTR
ncbi:hypothetical protein M426DRAFT_6755 [Hypoxylon sp. CI-4A]|nr:hypothetical protein M426DRAFT_6755 [Hypoxylon sp. CI-4A]